MLPPLSSITFDTNGNSNHPPTPPTPHPPQLVLTSPFTYPSAPKTVHGPRAPIELMKMQQIPKVESEVRMGGRMGMERRGGRELQRRRRQKRGRRERDGGGKTAVLRMSHALALLIAALLSATKAVPSSRHRWRLGGRAHMGGGNKNRKSCALCSWSWQWPGGVGKKKKAERATKRGAGKWSHDIHLLKPEHTRTNEQQISGCRWCRRYCWEAEAQRCLKVNLSS